MDVDLRPNTKEAPEGLEAYTDSIFAAVRSAVAAFIRRSEFYNKRGNPDSLYTEIFRIYLRYCQEPEAIQYMTLWHARGMVAKYSLAVYNSKFSRASSRRKSSATKSWSRPWPCSKPTRAS